jgi:hypothetical protein
LLFCVASARLFAPPVLPVTDTSAVAPVLPANYAPYGPPPALLQAGPASAEGTWWYGTALVFGVVGGYKVSALAHHVQKKATRKHNAYRPRKSRPSDINRTPTIYPPLPDIPWYTKLESTATGAAQPQSASA